MALQRISDGSHQLFIGILPVAGRNSEDQAEEVDLLFRGNRLEVLCDARMRAGKAIDQIQRLDRCVVALFFHEGDECLIQE